jgi:alpha-tubulin suppressor-like RCC1 family protein
MDSGVTWTARESSRYWTDVATSADGTKLVASVEGGQLHTSTDSGVTWTPRESSRDWAAVASSNDGTELVATVYDGKIYVSFDSGVTWTPHENDRSWYVVASSGDGTRLLAFVDGGQLYTSGGLGEIASGGQGSSSTYQLLSSGQWAAVTSQISPNSIGSGELASDLTLGGTTTGTFVGDGSGLTGLPSPELLLTNIMAPPIRPVVAWGDNDKGQTKVPTLSNVSAVAAGSAQNLALHTDGTVTAWGTGASVPGGLTNVTDIAAGTAHFLARKSDGTVTGWGDDAFGQSADQGLTTATKVAAGEKHSIALQADGTVTVWGDNSFDQTMIPGGLANVTAIAAGYDHSLALKADGTVVAWGRDDAGQVTGTASVVGTIVGVIDDTHYLLSENLPAATNNLTYNGTLTLSSTSDGSNIVTVADTTGLTPGMIVAETGIVSPGGLTNIVAIAAGAYHSLALKDDGTVYAWGWNSGGQSTPPPGLTGGTAISGGYAFSVALKSDGTLVTWGDNTDGQTTIPSEATQVTAIAAGASHALALRADLIPAQVARLDQDNVFSGKVGIKRVPATNSLEVEGQASKTIAGNWGANSDRRIKTEIQPLSQAMQTLDRVRLVDFRYTDDYLAAHPSIEDTRYLNVIAQEFAEVFPEHVSGSGEFLPDGSEILQVDTYPLTIYSAAAVQELHRENEALKSKLAEQELRLRKLEAMLNP